MTVNCKIVMRAKEERIRIKHFFDWLIILSNDESTYCI